MFDWGGTEPDSRQKRAGPTRQGRSAIRGCSGGTGQPAAAPLHEGRGAAAFHIRLRVRAAAGVLGVTTLHARLSMCSLCISHSENPQHALQVKKEAVETLVERAKNNFADVKNILLLIHIKNFAPRCF